MVVETNFIFFFRTQVSFDDRSKENNQEQRNSSLRKPFGIIVADTLTCKSCTLAPFLGPGLTVSIRPPVGFGGQKGGPPPNLISALSAGHSARTIGWCCVQRAAERTSASSCGFEKMLFRVPMLSARLGRWPKCMIADRQLGFAVCQVEMMHYSP